MVVKNLINAVDGMVPYAIKDKPGWSAFPQKNSYPQAPGFTRDLNLNGEHTFNKLPKGRCYKLSGKNTGC